MLWCVAALVVSQTPGWLERARSASGSELVELQAPAFCDAARQGRLYAFEVLCGAEPASITSAHWRASGRDDTWTVRVDTLRFEKADQVSAVVKRLRELVKGAGISTERPDGGTSPTLSWCETSYVASGDTLVVASVQCGALRPWCSVTKALLTTAGPGATAIVGRAGGRASVVTEASAVCQKPSP